MSYMQYINSNLRKMLVQKQTTVLDNLLGRRNSVIEGKTRGIHLQCIWITLYTVYIYGYHTFYSYIYPGIVH